MEEETMTSERDGDETYSLIFSSLKHPIRRRILRMLKHSELTFSEILETLAIDSGHLSYHLENLGDLITHTPNGKYKLSSFGTAAVRLMEGVEEYHPQVALKSWTKVNHTLKIISTILAVSLLIISYCSLTFTTTAQTEVTNWSNIPLVLAQNQTFTYFVNFSYGERFETLAASYGIRIVTSDFDNLLNKWTEYYLILDFQINQTYQLNVTILEPSSKAISSALWYGDPSYFAAGSGAVITRPGNYTVEIRNISTESLNGKMGIQVLEQLFQRPLFYYGLGGLVALTSYLIIILLAWSWPRNRKNLTREQPS